MKENCLGIPQYIKDLLDPEAYPEPTASVELVQTHISYILLTPVFVYKIKKPVDFGFLDFTTLDKRLHFCNEEVRLNKRLAPGVYLGVVGVNDDGGRARLEGSGKVTDYAVKMRRLNEDTILEEMLKKDAVTDETIRRVARRIARFHREAESDNRITRFGSTNVIRSNVEENFSQTEPQISSTITRGLFEKIKAFSSGFLDANEDLFRKRMSGGYIRDCHGDIHSEHISVADDINIFDCIEFNERFRCSDTIADLAFLSMDLDFHNRADLSRTLDEEYIMASGDRDGAKLLNFYKCYRAYIRGKVEGFKHCEPEVQGEEKTLAFINARHHYHLSGQYAEGGFRPLLVIIRGLSGTGKSAVAAGLSEATGAIVISSDGVRKKLAGLKPEEHSFVPFKKGIYTEEFTEKTYAELIRSGVEGLKSGRSTILDATFSKKAHIEKAHKEAEKAGTPEGLIHVFECTAPDEVLRERIAKRTVGGRRPGAAVSDMRTEIFHKQKKAYEKIDTPYTIIDTSAPAHDPLLDVIKHIYS